MATLCGFARGRVRVVQVLLYRPCRGRVVSNIDLVALDATALAREVCTRHLSARQLVEATLRRIAELEPDLNAFRTVLGQSAYVEAEQIDALPDSEFRLLPLADVPVAIKGRHRCRRPVDQVGVRRESRTVSPRCGNRPTPSASGRHCDWEDQRSGVDAVAVDSVRGIRDHPQPVGCNPDARRFIG